MIGAARARLPARHKAFMVPPATRLPAPALDTAPLAFLALVAGAIAMGISPVFVRFAEVGPFTSAFWRVALALPALVDVGGARAPAGDAAAARPRRARISVFLAGLLFAGDLTFWHLAIMNTSVANATFLATLAPVWVVLGSGLFLGERVGLAGLRRPRALPRSARRR